METDPRVQRIKKLKKAWSGQSDDTDQGAHKL